MSEQKSEKDPKEGQQQGDEQPTTDASREAAEQTQQGGQGTQQGGQGGQQK